MRLLVVSAAFLTIFATGYGSEGADHPHPAGAPPAAASPAGQQWGPLAL